MFGRLGVDRAIRLPRGTDIDRGTSQTVYDNGGRRSSAMWKTMPRHWSKLTTDSDTGREDSDRENDMVSEITVKNENEMSVILVGTDATMSFVSVHIHPQQNRRRSCRP